MVVEKKRVSLFEVGRENKFILIEYSGVEPSTELVHKIAERAVGERLKAVPRGHADATPDETIFI